MKKIIIVLALTLATSACSKQNKVPDTQSETNSVSSVASSNSVSSDVGDNTEAWNTFGSRKFGFRFKHPADYEVVQPYIGHGLPAEDETELSIHNGSIYLFIRELEYSGSNGEFWQHGSVDKVVESLYMNDQQQRNTRGDIGNTVIGNQPAYVYRTHKGSHNEVLMANAAEPTTIIIFSNGKTNYVAHFLDPHSDMAIKILQTLSFE